MSRLPPIPDPLECVLFDAVDTLLAPAPGFQGRFAAVAVSGRLGVAKPDPGIFKAALDDAGADPGATVHVGAHRVEDRGGLLELVG